MSARFFSAAELAELRLPGLPTYPNKIRERAVLERWSYVEDKRPRAGDVKLYDIASLPAVARAAILARGDVQEDADANTDAAPCPLSGCPERHLAKARKQYRLAVAVHERVRRGSQLLAAIEHVEPDATKHRSIRRWYEKCRKLAGDDTGKWLALLLPRWVSKSEPDPIDPDFYGAFYAIYMRPEKQSFAAAYESTVLDSAPPDGWTKVPTLRAVIRHFKRTTTLEQIMLAREGERGLKSLRRPLKRSRAHWHALQHVCADGHKWDVHVRWPDPDGGPDLIVRPIIVAWQDLMSGKILAWRLDRTENSDLVRLSFADLVEEWGVPEGAWFDNGRAFAAKCLTGQSESRRRFKAREEDPKGIFPLLGVKDHWANAYSGRSKPIERAWRDLCDRISKSFLCRGAYTGKDTSSKPANYGTNVVDYDDFERIVAEQIKRHNARTGRTSETCRGRSFDETFNTSYAVSSIRKLSEEQRALVLLAVDGKQVRQDGAIRLHGNIYAAQKLHTYAGRNVVVRFDPHHLKKGLYVYEPDGAYVCFAACEVATGHDDVGAAAAEARAIKTMVREEKRIAAARQTISNEELDRRHRAAMGLAEKRPRPSAKIIRPVFGAKVATPTDVPIEPTRAELAREKEQDDFILDVGRDALAMLPRRISSND